MAATLNDPVGASWDALVAALDRSDHRARRRIHRDLIRAASHLACADRDCTADEYRRIAALTLIDAICSYRLAGGGIDHLLAVTLHSYRAGRRYPDDVTGTVGERAALADERLRIAADDQHPVWLWDLDKRAAGLERPRTDDHPIDYGVTTLGEHAAAYDQRRPNPLPYRDGDFTDRGPYR